VAETPPTGGVVVDHAFKALRVYRYTSPSEQMVLLAEVLLFLLVGYYIVMAATSIYRFGICTYLSDNWNMLELVNLCLFTGVFCTRVFINMFLADSVDLDPKQKGFSDFFMLATASGVELNMNSINCMLCYFKVLKYMYIWPRIDLLVQSLVNAKADLITVGLIFLIMFSGFSMSFTLIFANDIADFYTFYRS
jgi:hypothetical protein